MDNSPTRSESDQELVKTAKTSNKSTRTSKKAKADITRDDFLNFKHELSNIIDTKFSKMEATLTEIKTTNIDLEKTLEFISTQYEDLRKKMEKLEQENKSNSAYIHILEEKVEELQTNCKKSSIEIRNLPIEDKESKITLTKRVLTITSSLNIDIKTDDIKDVFRTRKNESKTIIVEMANVNIKNEILKAVKKYNNINKNNKLNATNAGIKGKNDPIYISESLTARARRIYYLARDLKRQNTISYCWTSNGKVLIRKTENSPAVVIRSEAQIDTFKAI